MNSASPPPAPPATAVAAVAPPSRRTVAGASSRGRRLAAGVLALGALAILVVATVLSPSEAGLGTHEQLGLPPCGWITIMDIPCPTCGMTTSFTHAANGNLLTSFRTQPLGFALAVVTAMALLLGTYVALTGSMLLVVLSRFWTARLAWVVGGLALLAWGYKLLSYKGILP